MLMFGSEEGHEHLHAEMLFLWFEPTISFHLATVWLRQGQ